MVSIEKQEDYYRVSFDYDARLLAYFNNLPKNLVTARKETTVFEGTNVDVWYRYLEETTFTKFLIFIKDNAYEMSFINFSDEEFSGLKKIYKERRNRIRQMFKGKTKNLDYSKEDFSFLKKEPRPYQKEAFVFFNQTKGLAILGDEPGVGKAMKINELIVTPDGWKEIGNLKINDQVFSHDGKSYSVTGVYPQGKQDTYKVTFNDGYSCECNLEHLWLVRDQNRRRKSTAKWIVKTLQELMISGLENKTNTKRIESGRKPSLKWEIPITNPVNFERKNYLIHPYILGALLGDGNLCSGKTGLSISNNQLEIKHIIESLLPIELKFNLPKKYEKICPQYFIIKNTKVANNIFTDEIRRLKLDVKGLFKFIPNEYKFGSIEQRIDLLKGLMDTDGSCLKNRTHYHTHSKLLAEDVVELVQSLGGQAFINEYDRKEEYKNIEYRVNVKTYFCPFNLESKISQWKPYVRNYPSRYIKSVEKTGIDEHVCISVDSPEKTYLTRNYIVTHNTYPPMIYASKNKLKTLVICPASLKLTWRNSILEFTHDLPFVYKYSPPKKLKIKTYSKEESLFHIINYESLDTYFKLNYSHTCANALCKVKFVDHKKKHKACPKCNVEGSVKSHICKALTPYEDKLGIILNSEDYDMVVLDECHFIKDMATKRTKLVKKLFSPIPKRILLSGTAIKNRTRELFPLLNFIDPKKWENFHYFGLNYCAGYEGNFGWDYQGASNLEELFGKMSSNFLRRQKSDVLKDLPPKTYIEIPITLTEKQYKEYEKVQQDVIDAANETNESDLDGGGEVKFIQSIQKLRQYTSKVKAEASIDYLNTIKETGRKIVVFSHYVASAEMLHEHFKEDSVIFTGKVSMQDKQNAVDKFQNDKLCFYFFGTIGAAGVGITLTAADIALFIDRAWSPSDNTQAEDRIHRLSQESDSVQIAKMICEGTIDEDVEKLLDKKESIINMVLDGKESFKKISRTEIDVFKELLYLYKNKAHEKL